MVDREWWYKKGELTSTNMKNIMKKKNVWNAIENNIFPLAAKYKRIICCRPTLLFAVSPILYYSIMNQKIHELSSKKKKINVLAMEN